MNVFLIVARDRALTDALRAALPEEALILSEATVEAAARRLVSLQADAIFLDDRAAEVTAALASLKAAGPETPVFVLCTRTDAVSQAALQRAGADALLQKPFATNVLRDLLASLAAEQSAEVLPVLQQHEPRAGLAVLNQHQMALRWLSRTAACGDDVDRLARRLVDAASDVFDAVRCAVLAEGEGGVLVVASHGIPEAIACSLRLSFSAGLMRWFDENASLLDRSMVTADPHAHKELQLLGGHLATPLLRDGRVFGAIVLGEKADGVGYAREERELLTLLARTTSVSMERAIEHATGARRSAGLDRIVAAAPAGMVVMGGDRTVQHMNRAAEQLLGARASEAVGTSIQRLGSAFADVALRAQASEGAGTSHIRHAPTGASLHVQAAPDGAGGVILNFHVSAEERVDTRKVSDSPFWEYLASRVAQEIKNPMVAVNTFAQLLPRKYDSEDFREAFSRVVQEEVSRINNVVETLFAFAEDPRLRLRTCDVHETVRGVLKAFDQQLRERSIQLETKWDPALATAELDPEYFSKALESVLQNSIDAMPQGGTLTVRTSQQQETAEVRVADTGAGLSDDEEARIFLPFYSTKERGMGLGLPLAERIMRGHKGSLRVGAHEGTGSEFTLEFPTPSGSDAGLTEKHHADDPGG